MGGGGEYVPDLLGDDCHHTGKLRRCSVNQRVEKMDGEDELIGSQSVKFFSFFRAFLVCHTDEVMRPFI